MSYRADGENVYQFGPAAGSSPGMTFEMSVTVSGLSGLRNAYRSVLSADGSSEISGASRWLDALAAAGPDDRVARPTTSAAAATAARRTTASFRIVSCSFQTAGSGSAVRRWPSCVGACSTED